MTLEIKAWMEKDGDRFDFGAHSPHDWPARRCGTIEMYSPGNAHFTGEPWFKERMTKPVLDALAKEFGKFFQDFVAHSVIDGKDHLVFGRALTPKEVAEGYFHVYLYFGERGDAKNGRALIIKV